MASLPKKPNPTQGWIGTNEAAKYLGMSRQTFSKLRDNGVFRYVYLGERSYRYTIAHLDEDMMVHEGRYVK